MMWKMIVRGNVSQITWDCKRGMLGVISKKRRLPTLALEHLVTPCNSSPFLFCFNYFPLPFGLNLATLQLCAWCMFLSYTNSWGAPIVGPFLLLTFTIFSHHSFKCTDPTTRVRGCVSMDLWVHARVESIVWLYIHIGGFVINPLIGICIAIIRIPTMGWMTLNHPCTYYTWMFMAFSFRNIIRLTRPPVIIHIQNPISNFRSGR